MDWKKYFEENTIPAQERIGQIDIVYTSSSFSEIFQANKSPHHRRCIDGKITGCGNCVGYCQFWDHPGYLTKELRKKHDCVKKGCNYYIPKVQQPVAESPFAILAALV